MPGLVKSVRSGDVRRVQVAEAAIRILARKGARGLTHRAVDSELGFPQGSASHYYGTRLDLLIATFKRKVELDLADMQWMSELAGGRLGPINSNRLADNLTATIFKWISPENRWRSLAGCELAIAATRQEDLKETMAASKEEFLQRLTILFQLLNAKHPAQAAATCQGFLMGVLYGYMTEWNLFTMKQMKAVTRTFIATLCGF